jgi:hypothetical protein
VPVQAVLIETPTRFLGKGWSPGSPPDLPLTYRVRLGRRFDPPADVRAFTAELDRYFRRELGARVASPGEQENESAVESVPRVRG